MIEKVNNNFLLLLVQNDSKEIQNGDLPQMRVHMGLFRLIDSRKLSKLLNENKNRQIRGNLISEKKL